MSSGMLGTDVKDLASCRACGAEIGEVCRYPGGRERFPPHNQRFTDADVARAKQRVATCVIRWECPTCGGPHSKAEHR